MGGGEGVGRRGRGGKVIDSPLLEESLGILHSEGKIKLPHRGIKHRLECLEGFLIQLVNERSYSISRSEEQCPYFILIHREEP